MMNRFDYDTRYLPEEPDLSCPCCGAAEDLQYEDEQTGQLLCSNCHVDIDWALDNIGILWTSLPELYYVRECIHCKKTFPYNELETIHVLDTYVISCKEHEQIVSEQINREAATCDDLGFDDLEDYDGMVENGLIDPVTGEPTSEYYILSDYHYDCYRDRR